MLLRRFLLTSPAGAWDLFRCANVICHEIAHQWFGNLVTAATWPDLLVNEGLATLVEYGCLARVLPRQIGAGGAAVLMRGMFGGPAGVMPGVHEGAVRCRQGRGWDSGGNSSTTFNGPCYPACAVHVPVLCTCTPSVNSTYKEGLRCPWVFTCVYMCLYVP